MEQTKAQLVAKFVLNDLKGILNKKKLVTEDKNKFVFNILDQSGISYMFDLLHEGHIDRQTLKLWVSDKCDKANDLLDFCIFVNPYYKEGTP